MRFYLALWTGKLVSFGCRIARRFLGRGGTTLPGTVAMKIDPGFLSHVKKPPRIIAVTGTNGKTTTTNMVADLLEKNGEKVLSNRQGANINAGVATALLDGVTAGNRTKYTVAVLETDERSALRIYPYVHPDYLLVTNLLRDSMRRNAHPYYIFDVLNAGIPDKTKLILNADDLISCGLKPDNPRVYYSIGQQSDDPPDPPNLFSDLRVCPACHGLIHYAYARYDHIGKAYCPSCGFHGPAADYTARTLDREHLRMETQTPEGTETYHMVDVSMFNLYDEMAVIAFARDYGISADRLADLLKDISIVDSRRHEEKAGNVRLLSNMAKGLIPTAVSVSFEFARKLPGRKEIVLMLDEKSECRHSSENCAFLYDVDFQLLKDPDITNIVILGQTRYDIKLRCLLAGIDEKQLHLSTTLEQVVSQLRLEDGSAVVILHNNDCILEKDELLSRIRARAESLAAAEGKAVPGAGEASKEEKTDA